LNYDLIGDIHGYAETLVELLDKLGYRPHAGSFRHPSRKAIFLGDFIDRGPAQRDVIGIVRPMIESGTALSVMGNHEFNAIAFCEPNPDIPGDYLRPHSEKNVRQHQAFLTEYAGSPEHVELIEWFRSLPLWLDLPGLRVVHACWDAKWMRFLEDRYPKINTYLDNRLLAAASRRNSDEFKAVETLLKGKEVPMPAGQSFQDKDGAVRHEIRVKWWKKSAYTYRLAFLGPASAVSHIPEDPINVEHLLEYSENDPPVFVGHYWMDSEPELLAPNIACLDYSVAAENGGKLVAYRWDGEQRLNADRFVYVTRQPDRAIE
jgi:hypothetical protein